MNNKLIKFFSIILCLYTSNASADMIDQTFYIRGDIIGSQFERVNIEQLKHKAQAVPALSLGFGYNFMHGIRGEAIYMHTFPISFHHASNTIDTTSRVTLDTIMFRGSIDIIDLDICKVFAGAGLGVSRTDQKKSVKTPIAQNTSSRNIYNRAAQLFLGISGELSHKTTIELGYLYGDYGKTQKIKDATKDSRIPLRSHNIFFGVRYEL